MGSLFKWEMKQTFSSKSFWILGAALVALPSLLLLLTLFFADEYSGYNAFLEGLNNYNAFVIFLIGVFAGIHVTGAFEGRKIQSAVMAGNSRFNILMAKFLSFITSVGIYSAVAITISSVIAFSMQGINGFDDGFARAVIVRSLVFIAVEIAYSATCFFASMLVRHLGGAIQIKMSGILEVDRAFNLAFLTEVFCGSGCFVKREHSYELKITDIKSAVCIGIDVDVSKLYVVNAFFFQDLK